MKKIIILITVIPLFFGFRTGEEFDEKKMTRDLEIAKNILVTLIKSGSNSWFGSNSIDASYIKDYGVVFTIPEQLVYFYGTDHIIEIQDLPPAPEVVPLPDFDIHIDMDTEVEEDVRIDRERAREELAIAREQMEESNQEMKERQEEIKVAIAESREFDKYFVTSGKKNKIDWENVMITFMTDYADLIGQLKADEKIVVNQKAPYRQMIVIKNGISSNNKIENEASNISAEVLRKDITAYKSGKLKRDDFIEKIKITKAEPHKKIADLEMFSSIFERFYSRDLSETFYSQNLPRYELLDGYGAVFHVKVHSPNLSYGRARTYSRGQASGLAASDSSQKDEEALYPKFRDDLKNFLLDYGRTIRSLQDDDKLLLEIKIQSCRECKVPTNIEVSTGMSTLRNYDQQKISKEKALAKIEVKEVF
jgi:hypothetical protein